MREIVSSYSGEPETDKRFRLCSAFLLCSSSLLGLMVFQQTALAQGYCGEVSGTGLNLGCAQTLSNNNAFLSGAVNPAERFLDVFIGRHDGLIFDSDWIKAVGDVNGSLRFEGDVLFDNGRFYSWENVYFGSTRTDGQRTAFDVVALKRGTTNTDHRRINLNFDRLTLENTAVTVKDIASGDGRQTGEIDFFLLGNGVAGRGGGLTLRNSSLTIENDTQFRMFSPGAPVFIRAESGDNDLSLGVQSNFGRPLRVDVDDAASLTFSGTTIGAADANLTIGNGGSLRLKDNSVVKLTQNASSVLPRSTINGGEISLAGQGTELRLTAPVFTDSTVTLDSGAMLRVQATDQSTSTIDFRGDNTVEFVDQNATILGSALAPDQLALRVGPGVTEIRSSALMNTDSGLQVSSIEVNQGTLDLTGLRSSQQQLRALQELTVTNGGVFEDYRSDYSQLGVLRFSDATIRSTSFFGSHSNGLGIVSATIADTVFDIPGADASNALLSPGLGLVEIEAQRAKFSGNNRVNVGISPSGECVDLGSGCIPGSTTYSGLFRVNVGNATNASFDGFDTVLFVPKATDPKATTQDYVTGGKNAVYTVAQSNANPDVTFNRTGFDSAPRTPTVSDLAAAGSDLPANLTYAIVNNPVKDDRVDISFVDLTYKNHPQFAKKYQSQTVTKKIVDPVTGNTSIITVNIKPSGSGATQTTTTVVTAPNGQVVSSLTATAKLGPATGTTNTAKYGQLLSQTGNTLPHNGLQQVATLHPEPYASYMTVALEHSDHLRNMVLGNARGYSSGDGRVDGFTESGRRIWLDAGLARGQVDPNGGLAGFGYDNSAIVLGGDLWSTGQARIGGYFGYGQYRMDEHTSSTSSLDFSSTAYHLGTYGTYDAAKWSFTGMAGVSWASNDATREAVLGTDSNRHTAEYDSRTIEAAVRATYNGLAPVAGWRLAPEIGLGYAQYRQDGFVESGDAATALKIDKATAESFIGSLGLNLEGPAFGGGLVPLAFLRYEHDFLADSDKTHDINASFATSASLSQTFVGTHRGPDSVSIGLGLKSAAGSSVDVSGGVVYTHNSYGDEFGGGFRINWRF